jgi:hypothetical protein
MRPKYLFVFLVMAAAATGCGESQTRPPRVSLTIVNAAPGFANLSTRRGSSNRAGLGTLEFPGANANTIDSGTYNITVETEDNVTNTLIERATFTDNLEPDQSHLYVMAEENEAVVPLVFSRPVFDTASTTWDATIVNAAETVANADIYIAPPNADLTTVTPVASLPFKQGTLVQQLSAGDYVVTVTEPGAPGNVLFTSDAIAFQGGFSLELIVIPDINGIDGVLSMILNAASSVTFLDANSPPSVRPMNGAADRLPRDFYRAGDFTAPFAANVAAATPQPATGVPNDTTRISVTPAGNPSVIEAELTEGLARGAVHHLIVNGEAGALRVALINDDLRRNNTYARIRILNAVNYYDTLNIYLLAPGTDFTTRFPSWILASRGSSSRELAATTTFELTATDAATGNVVLGPVSLTFSAQGFYTVGLFDSGDGTTVTAVQLDDTP